MSCALLLGYNVLFTVRKALWLGQRRIQAALWGHASSLMKKPMQYPEAEV